MRKPANAAKACKCNRCGARLRNTKLLDAMAQLRAGLVDHIVCTGCLTAEEYVGMHVRAATMDIGLRDGLIVSKPKFKIAAT